MTDYMSKLEETVSQRIFSAVQELLGEKHLYQNVEVSTAGLDQFVREQAELCKRETLRVETFPDIAIGKAEAIAATLAGQLKLRMPLLLYSHWEFHAENNPPPGARPLGSSGLGSLLLPSVKVSCGSKQCKGSVQPHNSGYRGFRGMTLSCSYEKETLIVQTFAFPYQCQNCKEDPLVFLVKREGLKLTLVGRSQFPEVSVPSFVPESLRKYYRNAIIANQTGFTLAAALYLRTAIEQYFYQTIPEAEITRIRGNPTGDELAELYAKTLPKAFPDSFPSLKKAYDDLSRIVHSGKEDDDTKKSFLAIRSNVEGHFKAIQLFKEMPR